MVRTPTDDLFLISAKMVNFRMLLQNRHRFQINFWIEKKQYKNPMDNSSAWPFCYNLRIWYQEYQSLQQ